VEPFVHREPRRTNVQRNSDDESLCIVSFHFVKGDSEKFKRISEYYNIRTDFKTKCVSGIYLR
jgi:hypothetical protein